MGFAHKIAKTYRTTSLHAALAGIIPLDLRIPEAVALYEERRRIREESAICKSPTPGETNETGLQYDHQSGKNRKTRQHTNLYGRQQNKYRSGHAPLGRNGKMEWK
ncbi:unnamed protein product [Pieris macdunnoughi]|uniref:Uncharacterized protein n=1 Tax=Pieris macdunnoughi TaxID=345717 RepID=A0A821R3J4_9NEOP|nr:unnamed protein product [Pieris macdunnoughi]